MLRCVNVKNTRLWSLRLTHEFEKLLMYTFCVGVMWLGTNEIVVTITRYMFSCALVTTCTIWLFYIAIRFLFITRNVSTLKKISFVTVAKTTLLSCTLMCYLINSQLGFSTNFQSLRVTRYGFLLYLKLRCGCIFIPLLTNTVFRRGNCTSRS